VVFLKQLTSIFNNNNNKAKPHRFALVYIHLFLTLNLKENHLASHAHAACLSLSFRPYLVRELSSLLEKD
jgi:hypothetical protein